MKKIIAILLFCLTLIVPNTAFAMEIKADYKVVPFTLNGEEFDNKFEAYLIDGRTYISDEDLTVITGNEQRATDEYRLLATTKGIVITFYPLREEVESVLGIIDWNNKTKACDIYTRYENEIFVNGEVNATVSSVVFKTNGNVPVNVDEKNMYLNIDSVAPVVNVYNDEEFTNEVNTLLLSYHTSALKFLEDSNRTVTREVFKSFHNISNRYNISYNDDEKMTVLFESKVYTEYGLIRFDKKEIFIDFANKTVEVIE